jgi:nicotinamidase/pyrazinamidase
MVYKGSNPDVDSYSAFFDNMKLSKTCLDDLIRKDDISGSISSIDPLRKENVTDVYICGIATDVCVGEALPYTAFARQLATPTELLPPPP